MPTTKLMRLALGLCAVCAASAGVLFSGAFFASEDTSEANSVSTAHVALQLFNASNQLASGTVVIAADDLRPGASVPRESVVELKNAGNVAAKLHLTEASAPAGQGLQLLQAMKLDVEDCGGSNACTAPTSVYSGPLSDLSDVAFDGTLATGDSRFVRLLLRWPAANDDPALYGVSTDFSFHWTATTLGN
jgi:hypothetical protein